MGEKPSFSAEDSHAKLAAREIQQQLLKDFSVKSDFSDWFSRVSSFPPFLQKLVLILAIERIHSTSTNTATQPEESFELKPDSRFRAEDCPVCPLCILTP